MTKIEIMNELKAVFKKAKEAGYKVVVASDEEGNGWNEVDPTRLYYTDNIKSDYIVIGVEGFVDEEDIFIDTF